MLSPGYCTATAAEALLASIVHYEDDSKLIPSLPETRIRSFMYEDHINRAYRTQTPCYVDSEKVKCRQGAEKAIAGTWWYISVWSPEMLCIGCRIVGAHPSRGGAAT